MATIGHNSGDEVLNQTAQNQLKSIVERVERLAVEKEEIAEQMREVFAEAKGNGFDTKIIRKTLRIRKLDKAKAQEERAVLELYCAALGDPSLADLA